MKINMKIKLHVKKGDKVKVLSGKEKEKTGKIIEVLPKAQRVIVERVNMIKLHLRARRRDSPSGIVEREAPIHISNVMVICPNCDKPTRIKRGTLQDGSRVRRCKKCNEVIDKKYGT